MKLGLINNHNEDNSLINQWLQYLEDENLDFTLSFRRLSNSPDDLKQTSKLKDFYSKWQKRLKNQPQDIQEVNRFMNAVNPIFIPRNHQVERAIQSAIQGDFSVFKEMNKVLRNPYKEQCQFEAYKVAPLEAERIQATFCGT